jgi:uncharacterized repeat protein (TIGR01451 family)
MTKVFRTFAKLKKPALLCGLGFLLSALIAPPALALTESFTGNTLVNNWVLTGVSNTGYIPAPPSVGNDSTACLTVAGGTRPCPGASPDYNDAAGQGWLRLTTNDFAQSASATLVKAFPLAQGFNLTFTYATYGPSRNPGIGAADGLSVFLFDPTVTGAGTGGMAGGGLGYWKVAGGVLGIGLDEYGNFTNPSAIAGGGGPGFQKGNISVRAGANATTPWNYLGGTGQIPQSTLMTDSAWAYPAAQPCASGTCQRTGKTIHASLYPDATCGAGQYRIVVQSVNDSTIDFNLCVSAADLGVTDPNMTVSLGFGASTGGGTAYHEVRMLMATQATNLVVIRTDTGVNYTRGLNDTYAMRVRNDGPADADGSIFTTALPPGLNPATVTVTCTPAGGAACPPGALTAATLASGVSIPTFPVGGRLDFSFTGLVLNSATGNQQITATIAPPPANPADLGLSNSGLACTAAGSTFNGLTGVCTASGLHSPLGLGGDAASAIPTLGELALALLALMLAGGAVLTQRKA